ncbi:MAG: leucine-rich repeat protein, partial [Clostridia bacterium]|nr:leucine-rich repeat protein [Clostridia bacterium]
VHSGGTATETERAVCTVCSQAYGSVLPHVHEFTNYVSDNNATYEADGTKTAQCNKGCGETNTIVDVGSMLVHSGLSFKTLTVNGTNVSGVFANSVTEFSFLNEIELLGDSKYVLALDKYGMQTVVSKTVGLTEGDNVFYVLETLDGELENTYTVTLRRRPMYTVWFNTNGGTSVSSQMIEEGYLASTPTTTRAGYDFVSWDYDFSTPITGNKTINASWSAHTNTPYVVEYYYQNVTDNNYTKVLTENKTGTTDTTANAEIKTFEHFTYKESESTASGNIDGDGSRVLKIYYTRDKYEVYFVANGGNISSGDYVQYVKYGGSATAPTFKRTGYTFDGFDKEYTNISSDLTVTAQWTLNEYTVTLNVNGGNALSQTTQKVTYNTEFTLLIPTSDGYEFVGWYCDDIRITDENGKSLIKWNYARDKELKAVWKAIFNVSNGTITGLTNYGKSLEEIVIPKKIDGVDIVAIGDKAFEYRRSLRSVTIGDSVTSIGEQAFADCTSLTSITIPDSVTSIGYEAFYECNSLTYNIKGGLKYLGNEENPYLYLAGPVDKSITTVDNIDEKCKIIGAEAFYNCTSLTNVTIPDSVASIGDHAFWGCESLRSVTIGESVTSIGNNAFYECDSLTSITIPNSVTSIGAGAFYDCESLRSVTIGESVTSIGYRAFEKCYSLTSITIPNSVTSIGYDAFYWCYSLTIYCEAESEPSGWHGDWNSENWPVVWGYKGE